MSTPTKTGVGGGGGDADGRFDLTPGLDKILQFSLCLCVELIGRLLRVNREQRSTEEPFGRNVSDTT